MKRRSKMSLSRRAETERKFLAYWSTQDRAMQKALFDVLDLLKTTKLPLTVPAMIAWTFRRAARYRRGTLPSRGRSGKIVPFARPEQVSEWPPPL